MTLGPDGTLSGTPASGTAGTYPITITATDAQLEHDDAVVHPDRQVAGAPAFTSADSTSFARGLGRDLLGDRHR